MKVIIAGGRDCRFNWADIVALNQWQESMPITEVVSGGARGADAAGERWAKSRGIPVRVFKADWDAHGKAAGPMRNRQMAEYADACILFPGGAGTASMRAEALRARIHLRYRQREG